MLYDFRFALGRLSQAKGSQPLRSLSSRSGCANTAIFSLMNTMLFQPPKYAKASEIVQVQVYSQDKKNPKNVPGRGHPAEGIHRSHIPWGHAFGNSVIRSLG